MVNYIQIKKAKLEPDKFGNYITITMIGLYDESGKWIKWIKLDDKAIELLTGAKIEL